MKKMMLCAALAACLVGTAFGQEVVVGPIKTVFPPGSPGSVTVIVLSADLGLGKDMLNPMVPVNGIAGPAGVSGVTSKLPADVRSLQPGPVVNGIQVLPQQLRQQFGGKFLLDLGQGRVFVAGQQAGDLMVAMSGWEKGGGMQPTKMGTQVLGLLSGGMSPLQPQLVAGPAPNPGPVTMPVAPPAPPANAVAQQASVQQLQFLKVSNQTKSPVQVFVQSQQKQQPLVYNVQAGAADFLAVGKDQRLMANRVLIWATGGGRTWQGHRQQPLDLNAGKRGGLQAVTWTIR